MLQGAHGAIRDAMVRGIYNPIRNEALSGYEIERKTLKA